MVVDERLDGWDTSALSTLVLDHASVSTLLLDHSGGGGSSSSPPRASTSAESLQWPEAPSGSGEVCELLRRLLKAPPRKERRGVEEDDERGFISMRVGRLIARHFCTIIDK
jgi:hypothetical protein